jgi:pimeloyl-[acyl-carrier protein] methyl ester esterase
VTSLTGGWILVPGWGAGRDAFAAILTHLPGTAARVVGWDELLDRGDAALADACAALGPGPVRIAGWSLGALLALDAVLAAPGRFAGLALVSGTGRFCADGEGHPGAEPRALRAMSARLARDPDGVRRAFAEACAAPSGGEEAAGWWEAQAARFGGPALARGLEALATLDLRARAGALRIPVRLVHGEADGVVPLAAARALAASLPQARLHALPGHGHALPYTAAAAVAAALAELAE